MSYEEAEQISQKIQSSLDERVEKVLERKDISEAVRQRMLEKLIDKYASIPKADVVIEKRQAREKEKRERESEARQEEERRKRSATEVEEKRLRNLKMELRALQRANVNPSLYAKKTEEIKTLEARKEERERPGRELAAAQRRSRLEAEEAENKRLGEMSARWRRNEMTEEDIAAYIEGSHPDSPEEVKREYRSRI